MPASVSWETAEPDRLNTEPPPMMTNGPWNELGDQYLKHGAFCEAIRAYTKSVDTLTADCQTFRNLASLHHQRGNFSESLSVLEQGIRKLSQNSDKAVLWGQAGDVHRKLSDFEKEHAARLTAVSLDPDNSILKNDLEAFESDQNNKQSIAQSHDHGNDGAAMEASPQQLNTQLAAQAPAWQSEVDQKAITVLNDTITLARELRDLHTLGFCLNLRGMVETNQGKYDDALHSYQEALVLNPGVGFSWERMGNLHLQIGQVESALVAFIKLVELHPADADVWNNLGKAYHAAGHDEDALAAYQLGDVFEKELGQETLWLEGQAVIPIASRLLVPHDKKAYINFPLKNEKSSLGNLEQEERDLIKEASQFDSDTYPESPEGEEVTDDAENTDDTVQKEDGIYAEPILPSRMDDLLPVKSPDYPCWYYDNPVAPRNRLLTVQPDPGIPPTFLPKSKEFSPSQTSGGNGMDQGHAANRFAEDGRNNPTVITMDEEPETRSGSGDAGSSLKNENLIPISKTRVDSETVSSFEKEIVAYKRVTEINPENDRAWDALGNMYEAAGLHPDAVDSFQKAIALNPSREVYHYHLGLAQAAQGDFDKAIEALQLVISMNMDYLPAHCAIAGYYRRVGKDSLAQRHITHARPYMEKESEYNRACFEAICGNVENAVTFLKTALETQQIPPDMLETDADLDLIRDEPLFQNLMKMSLQPVAAE